MGHLESKLQGALKQAMRVFPQGVTVVTTAAEGGLRGLTVSSFTSVSLEPPLVLFSIAKNSALHDTLKTSKSFAVNFLADDQKSVSDRFAGRTKAKDRFEGISYTAGETGSPIIKGVRAAIECSLWKTIDGGDHTIIIGEVVSALNFGSKRPLVYYSQQYTTTEMAEYPAPPSDFVW
jgi:3-hydroxy-9,10-secoandrosta-1,3,5(10)-triene-9,17-dione monooxygenase reductase component